MSLLSLESRERLNTLAMQAANRQQYTPQSMLFVCLGKFFEMEELRSGRVQGGGLRTTISSKGVM